MQELLPSSDFEDFTGHFTPEGPFETQDSAFTWVKSVARANVIVLVTKNSDKSRPGRRGRLNLACERAGTYRGLAQSVGIKKAGEVEKATEKFPTKSKGKGKGKGKRKGNENEDEKEKPKKNRRTGTKKCNCPFAIDIKEQADGLWYVTVPCGRHNHELGEYLEGHSYMGRLNEDEELIVTQMRRANVHPRHILNTIKQRSEDNRSTIRTIYNAKQKQRMVEAGGRSQMQQVLHILEEKKYLFWHRKDEKTNIVTELFWAHPDSVNLLRCFPLVILMDCTYKTNRYRMPLLEVVGVTSTDMTFSVGFGFLSSESSNSYTWVLDILKVLLEGWPTPKVFVTDRELGLLSAIKGVFPDSSSLLCTWHINNMVMSNCKKYFERGQDFTLFNDRWKALTFSPSEVVYESRLADLHAKYGAVNGLMDYLVSTWLRDYKQCFISAWTDNIMHLGQTTTQRVEGAHATLKRHAGHCQANFETLFSVIDGMIQIQHTHIKASFEKSLNVIQHGFKDTIYGRLRGYVSQTALMLIASELDRAIVVGTDEMLCGCDIRFTHGLPCAHELACHVRDGSPIQLQEIHLHWRKLSMTPGESMSRKELNLEDEVGRVVSKFYGYDDDDARMQIIQRLREISCPSSTSAVAPPTKVRTRGRPKGATSKAKKPRNQKSTNTEESQADVSCGNNKKVAFDDSTARELSAFEHTLTPQESACSRKKVKPTIRPKVHRTRGVTSGLARVQYDSQLPSQWLPHIQSTIDVRSDGHCGFRCIAHALGLAEASGWKDVRQAMSNEIKAYEEFWRTVIGENFNKVRDGLLCQLDLAPFTCWLTFPDMGLLASTTFNMMLVTLSADGCYTYPPLRSVPPMSITSRLVACLGFVNGCHFIRVCVTLHETLVFILCRVNLFLSLPAGSTETWCPFTPYISFMG